MILGSSRVYILDILTYGSDQGVEKCNELHTANSRTRLCSDIPYEIKIQSLRCRQYLMPFATQCC